MASFKNPYTDSDAMVKRGLASFDRNFKPFKDVWVAPTLVFAFILVAGALKSYERKDSVSGPAENPAAVTSDGPAEEPKAPALDPNP